MALEHNASQIGTVGTMATVTDINGNTAARALIPAVQIVGSAGGSPDDLPVSGAVSTAANPTNLVSLTGATSSGGDLSFTAINQTAVIDTQGSSAVSFTVTGTFTGLNIQFQWSNKPGGPFITGAVMSANSVGAVVDFLALSVGGEYIANVFGRYLQINTVAFGTGTVVVTPCLHRSSTPARSVFAQVIPVGSAGTDRSSATSTVSGALMAANTARKGFYIRNDTAIDVWINPGATAVATAGGGNIKIVAGSEYRSEPYAYTTAAINIIAASGTPAITAREF